MNMGKGWGEDCEFCPFNTTDAHKRLCGSDGPPPLINECVLRANICGKGTCVDTDEGYRCECHPGFVLKNGVCEDVDECGELNFCQVGLIYY